MAFAWFGAPSKAALAGLVDPQSMLRLNDDECDGSQRLLHRFTYFLMFFEVSLVPPTRLEGVRMTVRARYGRTVGMFQ